MSIVACENKYQHQKLDEVLSDLFEINLGTPQRDGLSPISFAIYLESALRKVRQKAGPRPNEDTGLPLEAIYADDCDFISLCPNYLKHLEALVPHEIGHYNLMANALNGKEHH